MKSLKVLNLTNCKNLIFNENNFKTIIENNIYLEEIILNLNDININNGFVTFIIESVHNLKILSLNFCEQLTDYCFTNLRTQNKILEVLNINGCNNLTDNAFN